MIKQLRANLCCTVDEGDRRCLQNLIRLQRQKFLRDIAEENAVDRVCRSGVAASSKKLLLITAMSLPAAAGRDEDNKIHRGGGAASRGKVQV